MNVVVQDHSGNPVAGLTRDDFILLDDGRPQAIQEFAVVTNQPVDQYTPAIPADTYSNRVEDHARVADSATIVLLDGSNTRFEDPEYARRQTVKFLEQIHAGDHVAVYMLGRELRVLQDFPGDSTKLVTELKKYAPAPAAAVEDTLPRERLGYHIEARPHGEDLLAPFLGTATGRGMEVEKLHRLDTIAAALAGIANHFAGLPGRKNLVWVSGNFPGGLDLVGAAASARSERLPFVDVIDETARTVNAANVAIYPVDAHGFMQAEQLLQSGSLHAVDAETGLRQGAMCKMAEFTGGRPFFYAGDMSRAIRAAVDDSVESYELGYYADGTNSPERAHSVAVSVRRMGGQVLTRGGYFREPPLQLTPQGRRAVLANAARSPLEATGVGMSVRVKDVTAAAGAQMLEARVQFGAQDVAFGERDGQWTGVVDVVFVQLDGKNRIVDSSDDTFDLKFSPERFRQVRKDGLNYSKRIAIEGDAATLRVILRDATTGATGSVSVPLLPYFPAAISAN